MDLITLVALDVVGIESIKVMKSVEQDGLYMVLGLAKVIVTEKAQVAEKIHEKG